MTAIKCVRKALFNTFGNRIPNAKQIIKLATFTGNTDPGQWAPNAAVVVHTESGIPSPVFDDFGCLSELWWQVCDECKQHGYNIFYEPVNGAVVAFYEV